MFLINSKGPYLGRHQCQWALGEVGMPKGRCFQQKRVLLLRKGLGCNHGGHWDKKEREKGASTGKRQKTAVMKDMVNNGDRQCPT